jgi:hypothetical protein
MSFQFNSTSRAVLRSLVQVIAPAKYQHLASDIIDHVQSTLAPSGPVLHAAFELGLRTYDLGALPLYRKRAQNLVGDAADHYFEKWEHGPGPCFQLARGLNQLMSLATYEQPFVKHQIGYEVEAWIEQVKRKRLTVFRDEIRQQDAQIIAPDPLRPGVRVTSAARRRTA